MSDALPLPVAPPPATSSIEFNALVDGRRDAVLAAAAAAVQIAAMQGTQLRSPEQIAAYTLERVPDLSAEDHISLEGAIIKFFTDRAATEARR